MRKFLLAFLLMTACGFMLSCESAGSGDSADTTASEIIENTNDTGDTVWDSGTGSSVEKMTAAGQKEFFKVYVSLGDSLTQGCQGINVEENRQYYSYPAQFARAVKTEFNQPLIEFPGIGMPNPEDAFKKGWFDTWASTISRFIKTFMYWYRADRYDNQANLNNFGISGATIDDLISYDGTKKITDITDSLLIQVVGLMNPFICSVVGLNPAASKSALDQALDRDPTFVSVWIGNNDTIFATIMGDDGKLLMTDLDK
ncbi:MAG: hypothetical protein GXY14_09500 [Spirochaetes bacterium]|nr:hypothetical protein [Spirochaetota bacterium]